MYVLEFSVYRVSTVVLVVVFFCRVLSLFSPTVSSRRKETKHNNST